MGEVQLLKIAMTRDGHYNEMIAHAREEGERQEKLMKDGLCLDCESNPQNPHLAGNVCLSCWEDTPAMGCDVSGCPNSSDGHFRQASLCKIHLADTIHRQYDEYLKNKSELNDEKQKIEQAAQELDVDLGNSMYNNYQELNEEQQDVFDEWAALRHRERGLAQLKDDIQKAMDQIDQPFPDEHNVFG